MRKIKKSTIFYLLLTLFFIFSISSCINKKIEESERHSREYQQYLEGLGDSDSEEREKNHMPDKGNYFVGRSGAPLFNSYEPVANPVIITNIKLNPESLSLVTGQTNIFTVTVEPSNASYKAFKFSSSNTNVAKVYVNREVRGVGEGNATITCTTTDGSNKSAIIKVTVTNPVRATSITLNTTSLSLQTGNQSSLTATILPSNTSNKTVKWISDNAKVAIVGTDDGKVTAFAPGTALIKCITMDGSKQIATCKVTVTK